MVGRGRRQVERERKTERFYFKIKKMAGGGRKARYGGAHL